MIDRPRGNVGRPQLNASAYREVGADDGQAAVVVVIANLKIRATGVVRVNMGRPVDIQRGSGSETIDGNGALGQKIGAAGRQSKGAPIMDDQAEQIGPRQGQGIGAIFGQRVGAHRVQRGDRAIDRDPGRAATVEGKVAGHHKAVGNDFGAGQSIVGQAGQHRGVIGKDERIAIQHDVGAAENELVQGEAAGQVVAGGVTGGPHIKQQDIGLRRRRCGVDRQAIGPVAAGGPRTAQGIGPPIVGVALSGCAQSKGQGGQRECFGEDRFHVEVTFLFFLSLHKKFHPAPSQATQ